MRSEIKRVSKAGFNAYFFCNKAQIPEYIEAYVKEEKCKFEILCWHKTNTVPTFYNKYLTDTEYIMYFHSGKGHVKPQNYQDAHTFFVQPMNIADKKEWKHPTIKPINIIKTLIRNSSAEGDIVLDPFMGSGTTAIAALEEGRQFIGFEKSDKWFEMATNRVKQNLNACCKNTMKILQEPVFNEATSLPKYQ